MSDKHLIDEYIEENPHKPGPAEVWLKETSVSIWALIAYLDAVKGDPEAVARDYDLPLDAVRAAVAYYDQHRCVIDGRLAANRAQVS